MQVFILSLAPCSYHDANIVAVIKTASAFELFVRPDEHELKQKVDPIRTKKNAD